MSKNIYLFSTSSHPDAININSLEITFLKPAINFTNYDYFIITSKQSCEALKHYDKSNLKPALCISKATALAYENLGGEVLDIGSGYGDNLIANIKEYPKSTRWLYLRAKVVASDFALEARKEAYNIDEAVLYESKCSSTIENIKVENEATLIFTSPSSIKCFLKNNIIHKESNVIVIGMTTAKALPEGVSYKLAKESTIESCFKLL